MNRFALTLLLVSFYAIAASAPLFTNSISHTYFFCSGPAFNPAAALADTIPPTITCPPSITIAIASSNCDTVIFYSVTADDDEPGVIVAKVNGINSGQPFPVGTTNNLFLAVDAAGNTASCSFSVTVNPPPSGGLICKTLVLLALDEDCTRQMIADDLLVPPFACSGGFLIEVDRVLPYGNGPWEPAIFGPADLGKTFQTRAKHIISGNSCWGNVKLVDSLPPTLSCSTIEIPCAVPAAHLTPDFLKDHLNIAGTMPLVLENCPGNPTLSFVDVSVNLPCDTPGNVTGYIKRTWMAVDVSGNLGSCVQTINRIRSIDHVVYPADITVSCADPNISLEHAGGPGVPAGDTLYSLLTAPFCEIDAFYDDSTEILCGGSRRIHRTWTITDACQTISPANPVSGVQLIDVLDLDAPVFQCPADTVLVLMTDSCSTTLNLPDLIVSDNCSTVDQVTAFWTVHGLTHNLTGTLGDFPGNDPTNSDTLAVLGEALDFPVGLTSVLYIATDVCGNTASCEIALQLWDSLPPTAVCDSLLTVVLNTEGQAILPAGVPAAGSSDACGALFFKIKREGANVCFADSSFNDQAVFCCAEAGDTLQLRVRVYDVLAAPGPVSNSFGAGQHADCTVSVFVQDTLAPVCTAPPDVTTDCDVFDPVLSAYGTPTFSCRADSIAEIHDFSQFDTLCTKGIINRIFRVFDTAGGQSGQCTQRIVVDFQQDYYVRFPDDKFLTVCDTSGQYNSPQFFGTACENMSVTFTDEIFTVIPDACFKIERTWKIVNTCTYDSAQALITIPNPNPNATTNHPSNLPGPIVSPPGAAPPWAPSMIKVKPADAKVTDFSQFWAADVNGYQYKQTIKVIDNEKPVISNCPSGTSDYSDNTPNDPQFWNESYWYTSATGTQDMCEGPVDLCLTMTDACSGENVTATYLLFLDLDNNGVQETVVSSAKLPGFNNVQFGNAGNPSYNGGQPRAFDERPVLPNQKYGFALQMITTGKNKTACVRWNTQQMPLAYTVPQLPHGTHKIRWYVSDMCGNESSCEAVFKVSDGTGDCGAADVTINGNILTEQGAGVGDVTVRIDVTSPVIAPYTLMKETDPQGAYNFKINGSESYTITPSRNDNYLNGVSTLDLVLINKHVLGLDPLSTGYKIIAADANSSRSVSTFDIIELRKLILGIYNVLPNSPSWRFVDADFNFPNPANPFQTSFPETQIGVSPHPPAPSHDFIGMKVGDVNGNVVPNVTEPGNDERSAATLFFELPDRAFEAGEIFTVPVRAAMPVDGFQFSLDFTGLDLLDLQTGPGMDRDNFAIFPERNLLTASWSEGGQASFGLKFRVQEAGRLSERLRLSNQVTRSEAYQTVENGVVETLPLALRFDGKQAPADGFELFQNQPNPFTENTSIGFYLPEAQTATLRLLDGFGREVYSHTEFYPGGLHTIVLKKELFGGAAGIWYYVLETDRARAVRKMVVLR